MFGDANGVTSRKSVMSSVNEDNRIKIFDEDGSFTWWEECKACDGLGGNDWSKDVETYDDWHDCLNCEGKGIIQCIS